MINKRPLTVVQLLPKLSTGGVERGTIQIAEALVDRGHRSIVISGPGPLEDDLKGTGSEFVNWSIGRKSPRTLLYVQKLKKLFLSRKVDIVHARSRLPAWIGHLALSSIKRCERPAWVTSVHGPYSVGAYSKVMVSGDKVIAISNFIREYILKNYSEVRDEKIETIPRGVDENTHNLRFSAGQTWRNAWHQQLGPKVELPLLTIPARLTRWKGQIDFLEILSVLKNRGVNFHGLIVGGASRNKNNYRDELIARAKASNLSEDVSFLGNRSDLREIMSVSAAVFSVTNIPEAFGRTTAEALSLGIPVVGYEHGGTQEIMRDWYPHGLVSVGNILEAADRTQAFLKDYPRVSENRSFTLKKMQDSTIRAYEKLISIR